MEAVCPRKQKISDAVRRIPDTHGPILSGGSEPPAVGTVRHSQRRHGECPVSVKTSTPVVVSRTRDR